ncbi:MAG: hypothetical protein ABI835_12840 [Chloroflexota bacterium]
MSPLFKREGRQARGLFISQKRHYNSMVKRALKKVRRDYAHLKPGIAGDQFFGSPQVDPSYLTIYLFFKDDDALIEAEKLGYLQLLHGAVISALREECYPQESVASVKIEFASRKSVKETGGIWNYLR